MSSASILAERAAELAALLEGDLSHLDDGSLLTVLDCVGEIRRRIDGLGARAAGEVDHRSHYGDLPRSPSFSDTARRRPSSRSASTST